MAFLKPCVESILGQSYKNFKLHIIDGGSTDATIAYIEALNDKRIILYKSDKRLSIEENWARFLSVDRDEFMTIIGHDDVYAPNYLEEMNTLIHTFPKASLYQTHFSYIDKDGTVVRNCMPMKEMILPDEFLKGILTGSIDIMATGFMMRSADYDRAGGIPLFPKLLFADDALWLKLVSFSCLAVSGKNCFSFRYHQNTSNVLLGETTFKSLAHYVDYLETFKKEQPGFKPIIEAYGASYIFARCREMVVRIIRKPLSERNRFKASAAIEGYKQYAQKLSPNNTINPLKEPQLLMAKIIDSNGVTRWLFQLFKKIYSKPVVK